MARAAIKPAEPDLLERIDALQSELNSLIEARTDALAATIRGLPRNL